MRMAEKLVALRKEKHITQIKLAEILNVSRQAISRWETGDAVPSMENLKCLSALYKVPVDYLIHENKEDFSKDYNAFKIKDCEGKKRLPISWKLISTLGLFLMLLIVLVVIGEIFHMLTQMLIICGWLLIIAFISLTVWVIKRRK